MSMEEKANKEAKEWKITEFEKLATLGTGTFGRVFLVTREGKYYALKILQKGVVVRLKQVQHTINEKQVLIKAAECPFIVNL